MKKKGGEQGAAQRLQAAHQIGQRTPGDKERKCQKPSLHSLRRTAE